MTSFLVAVQRRERLLVDGGGERLVGGLGLSAPVAAEVRLSGGDVVIADGVVGLLLIGAAARAERERRRHDGKRGARGSHTRKPRCARSVRPRPNWVIPKPPIAHDGSRADASLIEDAGERETVRASLWFAASAPGRGRMRSWVRRRPNPEAGSARNHRANGCRGGPRPECRGSWARSPA